MASDADGNGLIDYGNGSSSIIPRSALSFTGGGKGFGFSYWPDGSISQGYSSATNPAGSNFLDFLKGSNMGTSGTALPGGGFAQPTDYSSVLGFNNLQGYKLGDQSTTSNNGGNLKGGALPMGVAPFGASGTTGTPLPGYNIGVQATGPLFEQLGKTYGTGVGQLIGSLLNGGGYNSGVAEALSAQMQPQINRGVATLQTQSGDTGTRFSSAHDFAVGDYMSQVALNQQATNAGLYQQSIGNILSLLGMVAPQSAAQKANEPGIWDYLGAALGIGSKVNWGKIFGSDSSLGKILGGIFNGGGKNNNSGGGINGPGGIIKNWGDTGGSGGGWGGSDFTVDFGF